MEEGMPADEIERLIEGFLDEITTKTERCTCEAGYTFCHNIISDINWDDQNLLAPNECGSKLS
jgi:hypothetical protein